MNNKSISQRITKGKSPAVDYPELTAHLAKISKASFELYELTKPEILGGQLGVTKQALQYHVNKQKEGVK